MAAIVFVLLVVLGCLIASTCLIIITFSIVEARRTGMEMVVKLEMLGQRNYEVMCSTNDIVRRVESKVDRLMNQIMTPDPDADGGP